jgi:hypothetical protein
MEVKNVNEQIIDSVFNYYVFGVESLYSFTIFFEELEHYNLSVKGNELLETFEKLIGIPERNIYLKINKSVPFYELPLANNLVPKDFDKTKKIIEMVVLFKEFAGKRKIFELGAKFSGPQQMNDYLKDIAMPFISFKKD